MDRWVDYMLCIYCLQYLQDKGDGIPLHSTLNVNLELVRKNLPLVHPGEGYFTVLPPTVILNEFDDMSFSGHLVPWLVKLKLKEALQYALGSLRYFKGEIVVNLLYSVILFF